MSKKRKWTPVIAVDFDGVLHNYDGIWSPGRITGDAIPGAMQWLRAVYENGGFNVAITSARSRYIRGQLVMRRWIWKQLLQEFGWQTGPHMDPLAVEIYDWLKFPWTKPGAILYIDDRAHCFDGTFPRIREIAEFRPWNRKEKQE